MPICQKWQNAYLSISAASKSFCCQTCRDSKCLVIVLLVSFLVSDLLKIRQYYYHHQHNYEQYQLISKVARIKALVVCLRSLTVTEMVKVDYYGQN